MENKLRFINGLICSASTIDQNTQNLSAFNVIDQIVFDLQAKDPTQIRPNSVEKLPIPVNFQVISLWKRKNLSDVGKEINGSVEIEIIDPLGNSLGVNSFSLPIPKGVVRSRHIFGVKTFPITISGEYNFQFREICSDGVKTEPLANLFLDVGVTKR